MGKPEFFASMGGRVVILNGPPGCGKDTLARELVQLSNRPMERFWRMFDQDRYMYEQREFKSALFNITAAVFGIDVDELIRMNNDRATKSVMKYACLGDRTIRDALIFVSEEVIKPSMGKDFFGKAAGNALIESIKSPTVYVFSDGGFVEEMDAMCSIVGPENVLIVKLERDGCSYQGDSRNFAVPTVEGFRFAQMTNNGILDGSVLKLRSIIFEWLMEDSHEFCAGL